MKLKLINTYSKRLQFLIGRQWTVNDADVKLNFSQVRMRIIRMHSECCSYMREKKETNSRGVLYNHTSLSLSLTHSLGWRRIIFANLHIICYYWELMFIDCTSISHHLSSCMYISPWKIQLILRFLQEIKDRVSERVREKESLRDFFRYLSSHAMLSMHVVAM
jgi:hypothetical protein